MHFVNAEQDAAVSSAAEDDDDELCIRPHPSKRLLPDHPR